MAHYDIILLDSAHAETAYITVYDELAYGVKHNVLSSAHLVIPARDSKLADVDIVDSSNVQRTRYMHIHRNNSAQPVWGGLVERVEWDMPEGAPSGEEWTFDAISYEALLDWRLIVPNAFWLTGDGAPWPPADLSVFDAYSGPADNVIKRYVRRHLGALAQVNRVLADVTVAADTSLAPTYDASEAWSQVLGAITTISERDKVRWRMRATTTGAVFETGYPLMTLDRTEGNGVNSDMVFSLGDRTLQAFKYWSDRTELRNYCYVGGPVQAREIVPGDPWTPPVTEPMEDWTRRIIRRDDTEGTAPPGTITLLNRRETWADASHMVKNEEMQAEGDAQLRLSRIQEGVSLRANPDDWQTRWNVGDECTLRLPKTATTNFNRNIVITGAEITVRPGDAEQVDVIAELST